jgi:hypothetical protein
MKPIKYNLVVTVNIFKRGYTPYNLSERLEAPVKGLTRVLMLSIILKARASKIESSINKKAFLRKLTVTKMRP